MRRWSASTAARRSRSRRFPTPHNGRRSRPPAWLCCPTSASRIRRRATWPERGAQRNRASRRAVAQERHRQQHRGGDREDGGDGQERVAQLRLIASQVVEADVEADKHAAEHEQRVQQRAETLTLHDVVDEKAGQHGERERGDPERGEFESLKVFEELPDWLHSVHGYASRSVGRRRAPQYPRMLWIK